MVINNWVRVTLNAKGYDKVKLSLLFMPRHCNAQDSFMSSKKVLELGWGCLQHRVLRWDIILLQSVRTIRISLHASTKSAVQMYYENPSQIWREASKIGLFRHKKELNWTED